MRFVVDGRIAYLEDYTDKELKRISNKLTYEDKEGEVDTLIYTETISQKKFILRGHAQLFAKQNKWEISNDFVPKVEPLPNFNSQLSDKITLFKNQGSSCKKILLKKQGRVEVGTGGGKSFILLASLKYLLENNKINSGVVIVPSIFLAEQLYQSAKDINIEQYFEVLHGNSKPAKDKAIRICVINSLYSRVRWYIKALQSGIMETDPTEDEQEYLEFLQSADLVYFDEAHAAKSPSNLQVGLLAQSAEYFVGFSASFFENPDDVLAGLDDSLLQGLFPELVANIPLGYLIREGLLSTPYLFMDSIPGNIPKYKKFYSALYKQNIVDSRVRMQKITNSARIFSTNNIPLLILVDRKAHALKILSELPDQCKAICVFGGSTSYIKDAELGAKKQKFDLLIFKKQFVAGEYNVIIATSVLDQGVDLPSVGALILGGSSKGRRKLIQRIGRSIRKKLINKTYIIDYRDLTHIYFYSQYKRRDSIFEELGIVPMDQLSFYTMVERHHL